MEGVTLSCTFSLKTKTKASFDTQQHYSPHRTRPKTPNSRLSSTSRSVPQLILSRNNKLTEQVKLDGTYMGYETWLPNPPKLEKLPSIHNAASLAYIGDCVYELYARRHFLFPPLNIEEYNDRVMAVVRCEAQDALLQKLTRDNFLSKKERDILRWGKNVVSAKTRTKRRAGVAVYNRASSLETLIGHLYLTNKERLEEVMLKLGFSVGDSTQLIHEENQYNQRSLKVYRLLMVFMWYYSMGVQVIKGPADNLIGSWKRNDVNFSPDEILISSLCGFPGQLALLEYIHSPAIAGVGRIQILDLKVTSDQRGSKLQLPLPA